MRWIGWILVLLLAVSWVAAELPPLLPPRQSEEPDLWRRTINGWERAEWLLPRPEPAPFWLHPGGLALFQIAVSLGGFCLAPVRFGAEFATPA